jgi:uracil-DNA glycosylase
MAHFANDEFRELISFVRDERKQGIVFPPPEDVFNAFHWTSFAGTRVVILGQDPYHGAGQAHGLSFSVRDGVKVPPSLRNIYKEMASDLDVPIPETGNLESWARQGVLLLNKQAFRFTLLRYDLLCKVLNIFTRNTLLSFDKGNIA